MLISSRDIAFDTLFLSDFFTDEIMMMKAACIFRSYEVFLYCYMTGPDQIKVWYIITVNHSAVHCFYTNKAMVVTVFAVCCGMSYLSSSEYSALCSSTKQTTGLQK